MNIHSARPSSARPQSRINPITGESMPYSDWNAPLTQRESSRQVERARNVGSSNANQNHQRNNLSDQQKIETPRLELMSARRSEKKVESLVPPLNLSKVIGKDDESSYVDFADYPLNSPLSDAFSMGTPISVRQVNKTTQLNQPDVISAANMHLNYQQQQQQQKQQQQQQMHQTEKKIKQPTAWDRQAVREDLPGPSQRYQQQYKLIEDDRKKAYQSKTLPISSSDIDEKVNELKLGRDDDDSDVSDDADCDTLQKSWTQAPYSKAALNKIKDREELEDEKRKLKLLETVMTDQLCRPVISDPMQDRQIQPSYQPTAYRRGTVRNLHDSKIKTDGSSTENLLSRRVRFEARILTTFGRDAIRELTGFYFAADNSLTVYEFRQFGKTSKAMPFIKRGIYRHRVGSRMNDVYSLADIMQIESRILMRTLCTKYDPPAQHTGWEENVLYFETEGHPLPDSVKEKEQMALIVTDVDIEAKRTIVLSGVSASQKEETWIRFHMPQTKEEENGMRLLHQVQSIVKPQIVKRGIKVYTGLGRLYRKASLKSDDGKLNKYELERGLLDFHIEIPQSKVDDLWEVLDVGNTSFLNYYDFMRGFLGEMSETRKSYVRKAFCKIDSGRQGVITLGEMRKFYNANKHPRVQSKECSEEDVLNMFLMSFENSWKKGEVMYREFEEYYEGLSIGVNNDEDFVNILKNAWNI